MKLVKDENVRIHFPTLHFSLAGSPVFMRVSGVFLEVIRNAGRGTTADHLPVKQIQIVDAACQKRPVVFLCSNAGRTSRCCMRNHPIPAGHRVLKERQRGREEGQQEEKQDEQNQYGKGEKESGTTGPDSFFQRKAQEKGQNDGDQKNEDVGPERMNSRDARKGIEKNGNGRKTGKDAAGACRIKGGTGAADQGFQSGEEEEGKEKQLQVFPDGFVDGSDQRCQNQTAGPVKQEMQSCSGRYGEKDS